MDTYQQAIENVLEVVKSEIIKGRIVNRLFDDKIGSYISLSFISNKGEIAHMPDYCYDPKSVPPKMGVLVIAWNGQENNHEKSILQSSGQMGKGKDSNRLRCFQYVNNQDIKRNSLYDNWILWEHGEGLKKCL